MSASDIRDGLSRISLRSCGLPSARAGVDQSPFLDREFWPAVNPGGQPVLS